MTLHNLDEQLAWLLRTKPSIPPTVDSLPAETTSLSPIRASQTGRPSDRSIQPVDHRARDSTRVPDLEPVEEIQDMARLRTAPSSASKPRLLSIGRNNFDDRPAVGVVDTTGNDRYTSRFNESTAKPKSTPTKPLGNIAGPSHDVEIMDLTETLGAFGSPTFRGDRPTQSTRKRKSEEYESDLAPVRPISRQKPKLAFRSPPPVSSDGFSSIDDIADDIENSPPKGPPPPYSTIAPGPKHTNSLANQPPFGNATSKSTLGNATVRIMPDSDSDDDGEDDIVDFTGNPQKRKRGEEKAPDEMRSLPSKTSIGPNHKPSPQSGSTSCVPSEAMPRPKVDSKQFFQQFAHKGSGSTTPDLVKANTEVYTESAMQKITSSSTGTQGQETIEGVALLRRFFAIPETDLQRLLRPLQTNFDALVDEVTARLDEFDEAVELERRLDDLERRINAANGLSNKRASYLALQHEKEQLLAALRTAVKARQGKDNAMAANTACKEKIRTLENECLAQLEVCRQDVEIFFDKADRRQTSKSVAIESTQFLPAKPAFSESTVPSSSKVLQTQIANWHSQPAPNDQRAAPNNIDAYFAQQPRPPKPKPSYNDQFNDFDDDEEQLAANANLFTNHMGTPPAPKTYHEEDDFGIGEDDDGMLEFAQDLETNGFAALPSRNQASRSVFAERSPNRLGQPSNTKPQKPALRSVDDLEQRLFSFPWSDDVKATLKERFRLKGFRENQLEAINATLGGKDAFVLMPTGGGKSLCYQLPAMVRSGKTRGVTVVISPLLSLMEDQVQHLRNLNIQAFLINSETGQAERAAILDALEEGNVQDFVQLLYVTPEMLSKSQRIIKCLDSLHRRKQFARLVIDEAHCVSQWGHDFRPDYKLIGDMRKNYPQVPVIALTATATENVKVDVIHNLNIGGCEVFTRSFNRPNLFYEVRAKGKAKEDLTSIANLIKEKHRGQTGIIYCLSRQNCEDFAKVLTNDHRVTAHHYHAGMGSAEKKEVQSKWQSGVYKVIVATIAFGMGIDKANVRFVVHHSVPKSLEGYYQETGRAGRDGKRSSCYLYYGYADAGKLRRMIDQGDGDWQQKDRQHQMLRKMTQYCDNRSDCRRVQVLAYFSEAFQREECNGECDNCNSAATFELQDCTDLARQAVEIVSQIYQSKVTILQCMDVFRGYESKKVKAAKWAKLDQFGAGSSMDREDIERLFYKLLSEGAFSEVNEMNRAGFATQYIALGRKSEDFVNGRKKFQLDIRNTPKSKKTAPVKKKSAKEAREDYNQTRKATAGSKSRTELPVSTNVSSPVQASTKRKATRQPQRNASHGKDYEDNHLFVSDEEHDNYEDDDESDGFAPIREAGTKRHEKQRELGPPITSDDIMDRLDEVHRAIIEDFVHRAKDEMRKIMVAKDLRTVPFTDTMLRDMAIHFTVTPDQMLQKINGINQDKVQLYGKHFIKLVKQCKQSYDEMLAQGSELPNDPNAQNVIDLVSDDDEDGPDDNEYGSVGESDFEEDEGEPSAYFPQAAEVQAFNARVGASQPQAPRRASTKKGKRNWTAKGASGSGRNFTSGSRYPSNGSNTFGSASGVKKNRGRKSNGSRASGGTTRGGTGRNRGGGGISMMPT